jgi:hypothetical protein
MRIKSKNKWLLTILWLRRNFPVSLPTRIKSVKMKDFGDTTYNKSPKNFFIRINRNCSFAQKADTLLHEWAHCLSWFGAESEIEDHSAEWGIMYAKLFRTFIEWNYGRAEKKRAKDAPLLGQQEFDF